MLASAECLVFVSQHCRIQARRCKAWRGGWPDEQSWTPRRGGPWAGSASGSSGGSRPPACSGPCWGGPACRTGRKHTAHITAWTHSLLEGAKSQHELTAYLTVPNHGMNSQPTWQCQTTAWTHSLLDSAKPRHELTTYLTVPNHSMNSQPTWQCQITAWTHSLLNSAKSQHELAAYLTVPNCRDLKSVRTQSVGLVGVDHPVGCKSTAVTGTCTTTEIVFDRKDAGDWGTQTVQCSSLSGCRCNPSTVPSFIRV